MLNFFVATCGQDPDEQIEEIMARNMLKSHLAHLFATQLDQTEAQCLSVRFGLSDGQPLSVKATSEALGIDYTSTKKVLFSALSKLRKPHVVASLEDYMENEEI